MSFKKTMDKAIRTVDRFDTDKISNYLWMWSDSDDIGQEIIHEAVMKNRDNPSAAKKESMDKLNSVYSSLKSDVDKKLRIGYNKIKSKIDRI